MLGIGDVSLSLDVSNEYLVRAKQPHRHTKTSHHRSGTSGLPDLDSHDQLGSIHCAQVDQDHPIIKSNIYSTIDISSQSPVSTRRHLDAFLHRANQSGTTAAAPAPPKA
jgi:hypothetical protein